MSERKIEIHYRGGVSYANVANDWSEENVQSAIIRFQQLFINRPGMADEMDFVYCLVGNVVDKHLAGKELGVKRGSKHFAPGAKVYCFPPMWGNGYENALVIGKPRKRKTLIKVVMPSRLIKNWRLKKVYDPYIISEMRSEIGWSNSEADKERIEEMLLWLPERTVKEID